MAGLHANEWMTPAEQVEFAWRHRVHFEECRRHNIEQIPKSYRGEHAGPYRNPWIELAHLPDARTTPPRH